MTQQRPINLLGQKRVPKWPLAAKGHMPFADHRNQQEVREDEEYWQRVYERERRPAPTISAEAKFRHTFTKDRGT